MSKMYNSDTIVNVDYVEVTNKNSGCLKSVNPNKKMFFPISKSKTFLNVNIQLNF